jgi:hypothetical protein
MFKEQFLLLPDDKLIIETDRHYLDRLDVVADHLCAVRIAVGSGDLITLARIIVEWGNLYAEVFVGDRLPPAITEDGGNSSRLRISRHRSITPSRRKAQVDDDEDESTDEPTSVRPESSTSLTERQMAHKTATSSESREPSESQGASVQSSVIKKIGLHCCEDIVGVAIRLERPLISIRQD